MPPGSPHAVPHHHAHIVHTRSHLPWETPHPEERVSVLSGVGLIRLVASGIDEVTRLISNEHCFNISWISWQVDPSESKHVTNGNG